MAKPDRTGTATDSIPRCPLPDLVYIESRIPIADITNARVISIDSGILNVASGR